MATTTQRITPTAINAGQTVQGGSGVTTIYTVPANSYAVVSLSFDDVVTTQPTGTAVWVNNNGGYNIGFSVFDNVGYKKNFLPIINNGIQYYAGPGTQIAIYMGYATGVNVRARVTGTLFTYSN